MTITVLLLGIASMGESLQGHLAQASLLIVTAAVLDGVDGFVARRLKVASEFGSRLDTYVDTVAFAVAPAMLAGVMLLPASGRLAYLVSASIILSGVLRFTRGCSEETGGGEHRFRGMPIPVSASWCAALVLAHATRAFPGLFDSPLSAAVWTVLWAIGLVMLVLQVSDVPYSKPDKVQTAAGLLAAVVVGGLARSVPLGLCTGAVVSILIYMFSPLWRRRAPR
jgi:CDP-diacylglycerol--serine O-phosphatidyltransferase